MGNSSSPPSAAATAATASACSRQNRKLLRDQPQEVSRAVALAVSSGKMHACEANNDLDTKEYKHPALDSGTSKSISSSLTQISKSGAASKKTGKKKKHRKIKYSRRTTSRVKRLLYLNTIVPFINLAAAPVERIDETYHNENAYQTQTACSSNKKVSGSDTSGGTKHAQSSSGSSGDTTPPSMTESSCSHMAVAGKEKHANESMVGALLALKKRGTESKNKYTCS